MKNIECERWDGGRLTINREFAEMLRAAGLTTFGAVFNFEGGTVAKDLLKERTTTRIVVPDPNGKQQAFYLKRHGPPPWKEYLKPLLRLTRPILGARNEWNALLRFQALGIPTMTPVALGESGRESFLLTEAIEDCEKLSHWMESHSPEADPQAEAIVDELAEIARTMHAAGMHHQDFYLTHFLRPVREDGRGIHVIDLGRVREHRRLAGRWIIKDLAQLNYSARLFSDRLRRRFLESYLGRPLGEGDRSFIRRIERKTAAIARHSRKNQL